MIADLLLWAALRLLLLAIVAAWVPWPEQVNDLTIYAEWAQQSLSRGAFPTDEMWQYPPLAGPVFLLGWWLPGDGIGFALLFLGFDAAILLMLVRQAARSGQRAGARLWALAPLATGPLLLARFDVVPTTLAVAAALTLDRALRSGALAAIGAWLKVWPALVVAGLRRADLGRGATGALLASAGIAVVMLVAADDPLSFLGGQRDRGLQVESVAAWPFLVARAFGADVDIVYRYGAHEVQATGVGVAASACVLASIVLLAAVAVQRLRGALEDLPGADVALAAVLFSVVSSRVFSGQYFIWLLALAAVCLGSARTSMGRCIGLIVAAALATQLVYPWLYSALLDGRIDALVAQTARVGLSVAAAACAARVLLRPDQAGSGPSPARPPGGPARVPGSAA